MWEFVRDGALPSHRVVEADLNPFDGEFVGEELVMGLF